MKRLLGSAIVMVGIALASSATAGKSERASAPSAIPMLSQMDVLMIQIEDLDGWMTQHRSRAELREMNRGMRNVCEEVRDVETLAGALARDPQFCESKKRVEAVKSLQASLILLSQELSAWHATVETLAKTQTAAAEPASDQEREKCRSGNADIADRVAALEARTAEILESMTGPGTRPELRESTLSLATALEQLGPVVRAMNRLGEDPSLDRDCLSQIAQAQERLSAAIQQMESCRECLAGMAQRT